MVAQVFRVDEMGLAWNKSEKGLPVSITIREHVPQVHKQSSIPSGIHDKDLEAHKPNESALGSAIKSVEQNMQKVLEMPKLLSVSLDVCCPAKELMTTKEIAHPDQAAMAAFIEEEKKAIEADVNMEKVTRETDDMIVAKKVEEAFYELFRPFCAMNQATYLQISNRKSHLALNPNIHSIITTPTCACNEANTQMTHLAVFVEDVDPRR